MTQGTLDALLKLIATSASPPDRVEQFNKWIAQLQSELATYKRAMKREKRAQR